MSGTLEQLEYVGHGQLHVLDAGTRQRSVGELALRVLQLKDAWWVSFCTAVILTILDSLRNGQLVDMDIELLAESVGSVKRLVLETEELDFTYLSKLTLGSTTGPSG